MREDHGPNGEDVPERPKLPAGWPHRGTLEQQDMRAEMLKQRLTGVRENPRRRRIKEIRRDLTVAISHVGKDGVYRLKARRQGLSGRQWVRLRKALNKEYKRRIAAKEANDRIGALQRTEIG